MTNIRKIAASQKIIFSAALTTRLAATIFIFRNYFGPHLLFVQNEPSHIAAALVSGFGFSWPYAGAPPAPTAQQPPLYPLILAAIFKVFGVFSTMSAYVGVGLNIMAGALTSLLLLRLGKWYFNERVGIAAAWIWTLPWTYGALAFSASLSSPHLAALGFTALLLLLTKIPASNRNWFALGIFCGVLVLLQASLLTVFLAYIVWLFIRRNRFREPVLLCCLGLVLVVTPWTLRNRLILGRFIPLRDNFGLELWLGNRPSMQGTVDYSGDFPDHDPGTYARLGEIPYMETKFSEAKKYIADDPGAFVKRSLQRIVEFWHVPYTRVWLIVAMLAWVGAFLAVRKDRNAELLLTPLLVFPLVYYVTHMYPTYRLPIEPLVVLLATFAGFEITCRFLPVRNRSEQSDSSDLGEGPHSAERVRSLPG